MSTMVSPSLAASAKLAVDCAVTGAGASADCAATVPSSRALAAAKASRTDGRRSIDMMAPPPRCRRGDCSIRWVAGLALESASGRREAVDQRHLFVVVGADDEQIPPAGDGPGAQ